MQAMLPKDFPFSEIKYKKDKKMKENNCFHSVSSLLKRNDAFMISHISGYIVSTG